MPLSRPILRQAKVGEEFGRQKTRDLGNVSRSPVNGQHLEAVSPICTIGTGTAVDGQSRLSIGVGGDEPVPFQVADTRKHTCREERADRLPPLIPGGSRRHRQDGVVCEQRNEFCEVTGFPGVHARVEQGAYRLVLWLQFECLAPVSSIVLRHGRPRAVQRAVHRWDAQPQ